MKNISLLGCAFILAVAAVAQDSPPSGGPPRPFGPPGIGAERKIVKDFDTNGDKRLDTVERAEARAFLKKNPVGRQGGPGGRGGFPGPPGGFRPPGMGGEDEPGKPGPRVSPADVARETAGGLYSANAFRTLFFEFENSDWEDELQDFHGTDVDVPATLTVDGVKYPGVGVHFRGMSSYMMVKAGSKRSLNVSLDFTDKKQDIDGYSTLNLLNAHDDPSFLNSALFSHISRQYLPAPKSNLVRVVINGECWGVYANQQQFDKNFLQENFRTQKGTRWKVRGSPMGGGGLDYIGDDVAEYKKHYDMKSKGDDDDWKALIALCRTLSQTPPEKLEAALAPMLDVDGLLWFLAVDNALINCDGYWIRASDYSLYRDKDGKFHVIASDMNEAFRRPSGPGMAGGPGGGRGPRPEPPDGNQPPPRDEPRFGPGGGIPQPKGVELDPLIGLDDARKPLRSKVLAVPALRARYLAHVRTIADEWLDWKKLGPVVAQYRAMISDAVAADTRKLTSFDAFQKATADSPEAKAEGDRRRGEVMSLREFADQRRAYLLSYEVPAPAK